MLLPLRVLAGGAGTQAAIKTQCCYLSAFGGIRRGVVLKGTPRKSGSQSAIPQGRGWASTALRASLEITFLPTVSERVYWHIIKKVSFVNFTCSQFSIIHVLTDDQVKRKFSYCLFFASP